MDLPGALWGELGSCEHVLQIHDDDASFIASLQAFVADGLTAGEGVIVIATASHREALALGLVAGGVDLASARRESRYIELSAQDTLDRFMVRGVPDEKRFTPLISEAIARARGNGRKVRAFGEMVALLWARGNHNGTLRLERLWGTMVRAQGIALLCGYPRLGDVEEASSIMQAVRTSHHRIIGWDT